MPPDKALEAVKKMSPQSAGSFTDKSTHDAYRHIPVSWILCEQDAVLTPEWQLGRIEFLKSAREDGKVEVVRYDAGHCPNVSDPEGTARVILRAINTL